MNKTAHILLSLLLTLAGHGQQLGFDNYNRTNGLINNEVHSMGQDSRGFMYFGTPSGISVFDGSSFSNFDQSAGFDGNIVSSIEETQSDEMTLLTGGDQYFQIQSGRLYARTTPGSFGIRRLIRGKSGQWYACGYKSLYTYQRHQFTRLPVDSGLKSPGITVVTEWGDSLLAIGRSYEPLDIYNRYTWKKIAATTESLFVRDLLADTRGNLWIATIGRGILLVKNAGTDQSGHLTLAAVPPLLQKFGKTEFRSLAADKENNIWMASIDNGLIRYNLSSGICSRISINQGLNSNNLLSVFCDRENNVWIGSNQGVQKLVHKNVFAYNAKQGLPADLVLDILSTAKGVLTTGYAGIARVSNSNGKVNAWQSRDPDDYMVQLTDAGSKHYGLAIKKLLEINDDSEFPIVKEAIGLPGHFFCMTAFGPGKLLLAGDSSLALYTRGKLHLLYEKSIRYVRCITVDKNGLVWTGDLQKNINAYRFDTSSAHPNCMLLSQNGVAMSSKQDDIQCISYAKNNRIAIGCARSGIKIAAIVGNRLSIINTLDVQHGLAGNNVNCVYWYNDSVLLAGTGEGLDKIILSGKGLQVQHISQYYHLSNTVYSIKESADGVFWLGTEAGLVHIPGIEINAQDSRPVQVVLSSVRLLNRPDSFLIPGKAMELGHDDNSFTLFFAAPGFRSEKNIQYSYALTQSGQEKWSRPASVGMLSFSDLPPGRYTFKVTALNTFGTSPLPTTLLLTIRPAFWQTKWFISLAIASLLILAYYLMKWRINRVRQASALRTQMAETEMAALRAQMNPHFIFNCMNIVDGLITGDRKDEARDFLQKFSRITRMVLENSQYPLVPLESDLQALRLYVEMEHIRYNQRFSYSFDIEPGLEQALIKVPPLILQPFVENAIVHGLRHKETEQGVLSIAIHKKGEWLSIKIEDNGIGRTRAADINEANSRRSQHLGMQVTGKRIGLLQAMYKGKIKFAVTDRNTDRDPGTRVELELPLDLPGE